MQHQEYYRALLAANLRGLAFLSSVVFSIFRDFYILRSEEARRFDIAPLRSLVRALLFLRLHLTLFENALANFGVAEAFLA